MVLQGRKIHPDQSRCSLYQVWEVSNCSIYYSYKNISFTGVVLVSMSDSTSKGLAGQTARPGVVQSTIVDTRATFGDVLALISALFYALYVILLKVKIKSESRVDMQLFFGFVGLLNLVTCWPIGVVLHLTKVEVFQLPPSQKAWQAIIINVS